MLLDGNLKNDRPFVRQKVKVNNKLLVVVKSRRKNKNQNDVNREIRVTFSLLLFSDRVSVLEDRSLRLERVTVADEGEYSCEADNIVGEISAMGTLTVYGKYRFRDLFPY